MTALALMLRQIDRGRGQRDSPRRADADDLAVVAGENRRLARQLRTPQLRAPRNSRAAASVAAVEPRKDSRA
jgi:hypothetical protein